MTGWAWIGSIAAAGLALTSVPVIIHLLNRRRFKTVEWAAIRFLLSGQRRNRRRIRLQELLLLAMRILLILLLGLCLSHVRLRTRQAVGVQGTTSRVFVLDDSMSMAQRVANVPLIETVTAALSDVLDAAPAQDRTAIVSATRPGQSDPLAALSVNGDLRGGGLSARLRTWKTVDRVAHFDRAIAEAERLLDTQPDHSRELWIVSDFRLVEWAEHRLGPMRARMQALTARGIRVVLADVGEGCESNVAIEEFDVLDRLTIAGQPQQLRVTLRNHGTRPSEPFPLVVQPGDAQLPAVPIPPIPPGERVSRTFTHVFQTVGSTRALATAGQDRLVQDNSASLAVEVREALRVLGVAYPGATRRESAAHWVTRALDPQGRGALGVRCRVVAPQALDADLSDYDVVFVVDVRASSVGARENGLAGAELPDALATYVREGGGLILFLGNRTDTPLHNRDWFADGQGLSPLPLLPSSSIPVADDSFVRLDSDSVAANSHLGIFGGRGAAFAELVRFHRRAAADEQAALAPPDWMDAGPAQVMARFDDPAGSPMCAQRRYGLGTVVAWYTTPDLVSTDWPKNMTFVPVVNDLVRQLARPPGRGRTAPTGRPLLEPLSSTFASALSIDVRTPAYPEEDLTPVRPERVEGREWLRFDRTDRAGFYTFTATLPRDRRAVIVHARTTPAAESDLRRIAPETLVPALGETIEYQRGVAWQPADGAGASERSLLPLLLALVVLVLVVEMLLARQFARRVGAVTGARETTRGSGV